MVVFGVIANKENECLQELIKEFNDKLERMEKGIGGQIYWIDDVLIFQIINYTSALELPTWITYKLIQIKWRRKGYKTTFKKIPTKKLLDILSKEVTK